MPSESISPTDPEKRQTLSRLIEFQLHGFAHDRYPFRRSVHFELSRLFQFLVLLRSWLLWLAHSPPCRIGVAVSIIDAEMPHQHTRSRFNGQMDDLHVNFGISRRHRILVVVENQRINL